MTNMDLEKDFLKPGLEVSHKDGRRGKIVMIGTRKAQVAWPVLVPDGAGGMVYDPKKVRRTWVLFGNLKIIHLPPVKVK